VGIWSFYLEKKRRNRICPDALGEKKKKKKEEAEDSLQRTEFFSRCLGKKGRICIPKLGERG